MHVRALKRTTHVGGLIVTAVIRSLAVTNSTPEPRHAQMASLDRHIERGANRHRVSVARLN
jgi:hypothetical protein